MLQKACGESTLSKTHAYEWYSAVKSGRDVVKDLPRSGRPSASSTEANIAKVNFLQKLNRVKAKTWINIIEQTVFTWYGSGRLLSLSKTQIAFEKCFDDWIIHWHKCIISGGAYFEGDKINLDE